MKQQFSRVVSAGISVLVIALVGAGCTSGHSPTSSQSGSTADTSWLSASARAKLTQIISAASAPLTFTAPANPIDVSPLKGKRVFVVANGLDLPFAKAFLAGMDQAAKVAGMTVSAGDAQGDVSEQARLIQQAVAEKYNAIVLYSTDPAQVPEAVRQAKAAGIPMVTTFVTDPALPDAAERNLGVFAQVTYCYSCAARLDADYALLHSPGPVDATFLGWSGAPSIVEEAAAYKNELAKYCTECSVDAVNLEGDYNTIDQRITTATDAAVSNGKTNVIDAGIDAWLTPALATLNAAQDKKIMLTSFNGSVDQLDSIRAGTPVKTDVGAPIFYAGYAVMDEVYRALLKQPPVANEELGLRIFTPENIGSVDPAGLEAGPKNALYYGTNDVAGSYSALWGK